MYGEVLAESGVRDRLPWLDMRGNHGQSVCIYIYSQIMGVSVRISRLQMTSMWSIALTPATSTCESCTKVHS